MDEPPRSATRGPRAVEIALLVQAIPIAISRGGGDRCLLTRSLQSVAYGFFARLAKLFGFRVNLFFFIDATDSLSSACRRRFT
jgi:hypothetical protein